MTKKYDLHIRAESWLVQALTTYANVHKWMDESGDYNKTDAIHGLVGELMEKARLLDKALADLATLKVLNETLQKEVQPFHCYPMNMTMTLQECFECQRKTRLAPFNMPKEVRECPRHKSIAF